MEATRLERQYAGFRRTARIDAGTYSAFAMEEGSRSLVRVVTARGVALAVDAPEEHGRTRVGLLEGLPVDVDRDGHDEVLVFADDPALDRRCIAIVRIVEGQAREVRLDVARFGGEGCIEAIDDVDRDGIPEALVVVRYPDLSLGTAPRVTIALGGREWREPRNLEPEREARRRTWDSWEQAYRAAVELAALAEEGALEVFEAAIESWEMTPVREAQCQRVREAILSWSSNE